MKTFFLHGWRSTPGGVKPTYLKDHGHAVLNPALPDDDFDPAVRIAQQEFDQGKPVVVVGSSRGAQWRWNQPGSRGSIPLILMTESNTGVPSSQRSMHAKAGTVQAS